MCWLGHPDMVSKGLETNFIYFTSLVNEGVILEATEENYKNMIAQVILFNKVDAIVANHKFGGFKAQQDYYTVALLGKYYADRIDFKYIWEHQTINPELELIIEELIYRVWDHFQNQLSKE